MKLLKKLSIADYVTLTAIALILVSFWLLTESRYGQAIGISLIAVLLDFVDGKIARKFGGSAYGKHLDSFFDVLGFLAFPSLLLLSTSPNTSAALIVSIIFVLAGVLRLAKFTEEGFKDKSLAYTGMPVLFSPIASGLYAINGGLFSLAILLIMAPLMLSDFSFPKPKNPVFGLALIIGAVYFIWN